LENKAGKDLLNALETARRLRLSVPHVYTLAAAGTLPSIKFGRAVRFDLKDVEGFIQKHRRDGASPKDAA